jgi:hypothetical protein
MLDDDRVPVRSVNVPFSPRGEIGKRATYDHDGSHQQHRQQAMDENLPGAQLIGGLQGR